MSGITLTEVADATIPTAPSGKATVYFSTEEAGPAWKDDAGTVTALQGATGSTGAAGPGYGGTSTTSLAIGTGSKAFTTQAGLAYLAGARVRATSDADPTVDYMEGVVTSYTGTTLTVTMDLIGGSGTHTDWSLNIAGDQGIQGEGVPPTVVVHGAMGATETFDYGDGPAHEGTVDANLTVTLAGAVAGECIISLGLTMDGTGGWTVDLPVAVTNAAEIEAAIDDTAGAYNLIVLRTVDSGTSWYGLRVGPGATGATGAAGAGVPAGGTTGQVLEKIDATDYNTQWATPSGGTGIDEGTSFPGSPTADDLFYRTDLNLIFFYDGTRWLTVNQFREPFTPEGSLSPQAATHQNLRWAWDGSTADVWLDKIELMTYHASPTGSNFWSIQAIKGTAAESETNIGSAQVTSSDTSNNWTPHNLAVGALFGSTHRYIRLLATRNASATPIYVKARVVYRVVG